MTDDGTTGDPDGQVDGDDPWYHFVYDDRWRVIAVYRAFHDPDPEEWTFDADPKERFVYHNAGLDGYGGSSYIDAVVLRDRDANTAWADEADGTLEERIYYAQNWRADVVALFSSAGQMLQQVRYDPYGVPFGISKTDLTADGVLDSNDSSLFVALYNSGSGTHPFADWNLDGTLNSQDPIAYLNSYNADVALGYGVLGYGYSRAGGANRKAYAGYEIDPVLTGANGRESVYHVRHRVLLSELGRWNRRDPLGYVDGMSLYEYVNSRASLALDPLGLAMTFQECTDEAERCRQEDDGTKSILQRLADKGCPVATVCSGTDLPFCKTSIGGYACCSTVNPDKPGIIYLCGENLNPGSSFCTTYRHELIHAEDICDQTIQCDPQNSCALGPPPPDHTKCSYGICAEMRAVVFSGQCCVNGQLNWGCVRTTLLQYESAYCPSRLDFNAAYLRCRGDLPEDPRWSPHLCRKPKPGNGTNVVPQ